MLYQLCVQIVPWEPTRCNFTLEFISLIILSRKFYGILCATRKGHQNVLSSLGDHYTRKLIAKHHIKTRSSDDGMMEKITEYGDDDDDDNNHDVDDENDPTYDNVVNN